MSDDGDNCPFCTLYTERVLEFNEYAHAFCDRYPVTELHTLVTPKRHVATYFDLSEEERKGMHALLESQRANFDNPFRMIGRVSLLRGMSPK